MEVIVATFGDESWVKLARERAIPSAEAQAPVIHVHGESLAAARNAGLAQAESEWVVFLDADDELEPGYIEAMSLGTADLRAPLVRYVRDGQPQGAAFPRVVGHEHLCTAECLTDGNWIAIGACVRAELLRSVGGFGVEPLWEDYAAWLRCYRAGASIECIGDAIYRAHVSPSSRNDGLTAAQRRRVFVEIAA